MRTEILGIGLLVLAMGLLHAGTTYSQAVSFSATVPEFIAVTISPGTISFQSNINPTENLTANTPIVVTNTPYSNVNIKLTLNATDFLSGSDTIQIANLKMRANETEPAYTYFTSGHAISNSDVVCSPSVYSLDQNCGNMSVDSHVKLWFNLLVPGGTLAGSYSTNVNIRADKV